MNYINITLDVLLIVKSIELYFNIKKKINLMKRYHFSNKTLLGINLDIFYTLSPPPERVVRNHSNFLHGYPSLFSKNLTLH